MIWKTVGLLLLTLPKLNDFYNGSFFEPTRDGVAGHAESAGQAAQRTALVIGPQDFLPLLRGVAVGLWLLAAAAPTIVAQVTLFAIAGATVPDQIVALAINAFDRNRNHTGEFTLSHQIEPPPAAEWCGITPKSISVSRR